MKIILALQDAHQLDRSQRDDRLEETREVFEAEGIELDPRNARQITLSRNSDEAVAHFDKRVSDAIQRWQPGDLMYVDYEPDHTPHNFYNKFDREVALISIDMIKLAKALLPDDRSVGLYGLPAKLGGPPFSSKTGDEGFEYVVKHARPDWYGPSWGMRRQIDDDGDALDLALRLLQTVKTCRAVNPSTPIYPFVYDRFYSGPARGEEYSEKTNKAYWRAINYMPIDGVIWWLNDGAYGEHRAENHERIRRLGTPFGEAREATKVKVY